MSNLPPMIPVTINLAEMPEEERRVLCGNAIRRGVPFEVEVRDAMIERAQKVQREAAKEESHKEG